MKKKIFFARAISDYNSNYENEWIKIIKELFNDCEIIQFPDIKEECKIDLERLKNIERDYFFPLIDTCDVFMCVPEKHGKYYTKGVTIEMEYALSVNKRVIGVVNNELRDIFYDDFNKITKRK